MGYKVSALKEAKRNELYPLCRDLKIKKRPKSDYKGTINIHPCYIKYIEMNVNHSLFSWDYLYINIVYIYF